MTDRLSREIKESTGSPVLVNLASSEYFKAVRPQRLSAPVLHIHFMEKKGGTLKVIGIHAKRARGLMTDFIVRNQIHDPEELRSFDLNGYRLSLDRSTETDWIFTRG
ncbi:MAG: YaaA family protein [Desulfotignum sp.]